MSRGDTKQQVTVVYPYLYPSAQVYVTVDLYVFVVRV